MFTFFQNGYQFEDVEEDDDEMEEEDGEREDNEHGEDDIQIVEEQSERGRNQGRRRNSNDNEERHEENGSDNIKQNNQRRTPRGRANITNFSSNETSFEDKRSLSIKNQDPQIGNDETNDHDEVEEEDKSLNEGRKVGSYSLRSVRSSRIHSKHQEQQDDRKRRSFRKKSEVQRFNPVTPTKRRRASTRELLDMYLRKRPKRSNSWSAQGGNNYETDEEEPMATDQYEFADREPTHTDSLPTPINFPRSKLSKGSELSKSLGCNNNFLSFSLITISSRRCRSDDY